MCPPAFPTTVRWKALTILLTTLGKRREVGIPKCPLLEVTLQV